MVMQANGSRRRLQVPLRKLHQPRHRLRRRVRLLVGGGQEAGPARRAHAAAVDTDHSNACTQFWLAVRHAAAKHKRRVVPVHLQAAWGNERG